MWRHKYLLTLIASQRQYNSSHSYGKRLFRLLNSEQTIVIRWSMKNVNVNFYETTIVGHNICVKSCQNRNFLKKILFTFNDMRVWICVVRP